MYAKTLTTTLAILALGMGTHANPYFLNAGTMSGWDGANVEHEGTLFQVTNVVYKGSTAIKATQTYDRSYTGRYHSEVMHSNGYKLGDASYYGFAFRLAEDWAFDEQSYNIAQFIADFSDTGCDDWMPSTMVWIVGNQLSTRVKHGSICHQSIKEWRGIATVSSGTWHTIEIQASWKSDGSGYFYMWFDGTQVVSGSGLPTTINDGREFQFHVGLYANGWHDDKKMVGNQPFRQVWFDEIVMGRTYADADPAYW
jgi:Polysaccharide lyase